MKITKLPTDDSQKSVSKRMKAVYNGQIPTMPGLAIMTKKQMAKTLQSLWTLLDETGVQRRNETSPQHELYIYGRVYAAILRGPIPPSDYGQKRLCQPDLLGTMERLLAAPDLHLDELEPATRAAITHAGKIIAQAKGEKS